MRIKISKFVCLKSLSWNLENVFNLRVFIKTMQFGFIFSVEKKSNFQYTPKNDVDVKSLLSMIHKVTPFHDFEIAM